MSTHFSNAVLHEPKAAAQTIECVVDGIANGDECVCALVALVGSGPALEACGNSHQRPKKKGVCTTTGLP